ncbi:MAG: hypothetical protein HAW67_07930, partial [Endozoicomonadaceae bacterium]|nr:hypothetical protein [Endozoicomonadaceae bacterium]
MVLHQIEESLGNFVVNNGDIESLNVDVLESIHKREFDKGRVFNSDSIKNIVEATYLEELFGFALDLAKDTSIRDSLKYLYSLFHHSDVYEIRNAISHPNRPFWDCYWYRIAAIASDPVNEILGLEEIKKALVAAEEGKIEIPPDEWINKIIWQIPNNLPKYFDHGVTGLIGRSKELQELKKLIENPRVNTIALVAPGGTGKTALALDLLNSIISTPTYSQHIDAVLYTTMKTEKLTADGLVSLDSAETITELKNEIIISIDRIFDESNIDFESAVVAHKNDKILLCLDNLETLLRDNPNSFDELNSSLPPDWQVLVTSRVAISDSRILSVEALKKKSAIHLARTYITKRGGNPIEEKTYERLTKDCHYNPLAIRLTLDLVLTGKAIPESLNTANKEIAEFSYNNLIEVLSTDSVEILEAIFVEGTSSRLSLCELLGFSLDEVSSSIGELGRTSLISRKSTEQGESYKLSDSVRNLLLISPRNIDARTKVQNLINKRRVLSKEIDITQNIKEIPIWHYNYIPQDTNENLKILVTEVNQKIRKSAKSTEIAVSLYRKLHQSKFIYEESSLYHRTFARVYEALKDVNSAERHYKQSISLDEENWSSYYLLARLFHETRRYEDAYLEYQKLIDAGWVREDSESTSFGNTIYNGYFLALLYSGNYKGVFEFTKKWKESSNYRGVLGTYRASAWKRKMEVIKMSDSKTTVKALLNASRILNDVFRNDGYLK